MKHGKEDFAKAIHLNYLWLSLVQHHISILSHQLGILLHVVVTRHLTHLLLPVQGDFHSLHPEEQEDPLMLVHLVVLVGLVGVAPLVVVNFLVVLGPLGLLMEVHLSGAGLGM